MRRSTSIVLNPLLAAGVALATASWWAVPLAFAKGDSPATRQVTLKVEAANPTMLSDKKETNYVRISLTGGEMPRSKVRPPLNVSIVIDNSGSMSGEKIRQAREAAIAAVERLRDDDIVSVVFYNSSVHVLVPATRATDRHRIIQQIRGVESGGNTALFAGVSKGAAEVRKFLDRDSVNRVILLSDGLANVGPSTPHDLEQLGESLVKEGISVSTLGLGLGYNEDLMSRLASASSGNHLFIEAEDDLVAMFNSEFNDLMSVVASDFEIRIRVGKGVRPVRVLGTNANIDGRTVHIPLAQLYSNQQRYFVLEVEVDAGKAGSSQKLATVNVDYQNMVTHEADTLSETAHIRFSNSLAEVDANKNLEAFAYCTVQIANERNALATSMRDAGQIEEAKKLLKQNVDQLEEVRVMCEAQDLLTVLPDLNLNIKVNRAQVELVEEKDWNRNRKSMRALQNQIQAQQKDYSDALLKD